MYTMEEELGFQEDLSISDRNDLGNICVNQAKKDRTSKDQR
jgi:hypothetical protein